MTGEATGRCPLCGGILRLWIGLPERAHATVGMPSPIDPQRADAAEHARLIDRCDDCRAGIERGGPLAVEAELELITGERADGGIELRVPNRASLQAGIGGEGWAALGDVPGRIVHTPRSLALLAEQGGLRADDPAFPPWGRSQRWMWQTLINGLTLHTNFAREVRAGRLRPGNARGRIAFVADAVATLLATPLVALVSLPLEAVAALLGRGGELVARAERT